MAVGKWKNYQDFVKRIQDGTLDLDTNTINLALFTSASNANTLTNSVWADLTGEVAAANGYTAGGAAVSGLTVSQAAGLGKWTATLPTFNASGGPIVFRFGVLYVNATVNGVIKPLIGVCLADTTPADTTITDGNGLQWQANASGIYTLASATTD